MQKKLAARGLNSAGTIEPRISGARIELATFTRGLKYGRTRTHKCQAVVRYSKKNKFKKKNDAFGGTRTHAIRDDYDLNVAP